MSELLPGSAAADTEPLLDTLLREAVPEIKLALGDLIDRENQRAIPDRYQKMLPESTLVVTLRPDAAEAVQPVAAELERELTDSCMRHGSLYDRFYKVRLRAAPNPGAPLFRVAARRGDEPEPELFVARKSEPEPATQIASVPSGPSTSAVAAAAAENATVIAPRPAEPPPPTPAAPREQPAGPSIDPDATRLDGIAAPPEPAHPGADAGAGTRFVADRFAVVVESEEGEEKERFGIPKPLTTVGRQTDNPALRSDVAITDAPHVSRRQLALVWAPRGDRVGFTVYNVGLNPLHVGEREVPGANAKGELELGDLMMNHTEWVAPGAEMVIGEHGPVLRIVDTREAADDAGQREVEIDPDATRFG
ncbi:MAG TPA: hypothetical protein VF092_09625 [Longimicrobium sp.]